MTAARFPVTVVIATRNESGNIAECIDSARWAAETIVADAGSTDDTRARAAASGAHVIDTPGVSIGAQRNAAIELAAHDWIFVLDADERASEALGAEVARTIDAPRYDAYRVGLENMFLGRHIRHGGWGSNRKHVRLFRKALRFNANKVHESVVTHGSVGALRATLRHTPYPTLESYFEKLGRYSRWWAEQNFARGRRVGASTVVLRAFGRFFGTYLFRGGWKDGAHGAVLAGLGAVSVLAKYARLWELGLKERAERGWAREARPH